MAQLAYDRMVRYNRFCTPAFEPWPCDRDLTDAVLEDYYKPLKNATRTILQVQKPVLPDPKSFSVSIINGPKEKKTVDIDSTNTGREMLQKVLKLTAEHIESLYLVCNGKTVPLDQKLCDLQLKLQVTFIICQKCHGG